MLKRTTVYLEEAELQILKQISFMQNTSMANLIRQGVQEFCKTCSEEQKAALAALAEIKSESKKNGITPKSAMQSALKIQKEVRCERNKNRR